MRISGHWYSIMQRFDDPLARQVLPDSRELRDRRTNADPLNETGQSPTSCIVHRYPGRAIFLVSNQCAVHCRYCMRKRHVRSNGPYSRIAIEAGLEYIRKTRHIDEVILSGGDPLMLADADLMAILGKLKDIRHVRILRLHTRIPSAWPQRVTEALCNALARFHPLYINIQFNHPDEITSATARACSRLADSGLPLGSQTVLLKGINDHPTTLQALMERLIAMRVRPYYLHQVDRVPGTAHFRVDLQKGLDLMEALRSRLSGIAMPHFMVDLPGGHGKVELLPESVIQKSSRHWLIRDFQGRTVSYPLD